MRTPRPGDRRRTATVAEYLDALQAGDNETIERIESEAKDDPKLASMIESACRKAPQSSAKESASPPRKWSIEVANVGGYKSGTLSLKAIVGYIGFKLGPLVCRDKYGKHWNVEQAIVTGFDGNRTRATTEGRVSPAD